MYFYTYKPAAPLSEFVENFWAYQFNSGSLKERIFPTGTFELVFNLRDDEMRIYKDAQIGEFLRYSGAIAAGLYGRPFVTDTALEASVMGVHFKPGGAFLFLGFDVGELRDTHIDLQMVWGRAAVEIRERLCGTASLTRRFRLLEQFLVSRYLHPPAHHSAVALALAAVMGGQAQMTRELAREAGLSEKRFIDVFRREVGMNPRLLTRISRFQRVLARTREPDAPHWADLASNHGYFDQSHLIRDFLAFSGSTPAEYVRRLGHLRSRGIQAKFNHLPLAHSLQFFPIQGMSELSTLSGEEDQ